MAILRCVGRRLVFAVTVTACLFSAACENIAAPSQTPVSSDACALAANALESQIREERPLGHHWYLDFGAPPLFWERGALVRQAELEQAGTQERFIWSKFVPEAPSPLPRFLRGREPDADPVRGPSVEMSQAFAMAPPINGASCPEVRAYAAAQRALSPVGYSKHSPRRRYALWFMVERAVISSDGKEAIVSLSMHSIGTIIFYRKQPDGSWRETATAGSWVS